MNSKKKTGSYYKPLDLADFIVKNLYKQIKYVIINYDNDFTVQWR